MLATQETHDFFAKWSRLLNPWVQTIGEHLMQMQMFSYGLKSHEKRKK